MPRLPVVNPDERLLAAQEVRRRQATIQADGYGVPNAEGHLVRSALAKEKERRKLEQKKEADVAQRRAEVQRLKKALRAQEESDDITEAGKEKINRLKADLQRAKDCAMATEEHWHRHLALHRTDLQCTKAEMRALRGYHAQQEEKMKNAGPGALEAFIERKLREESVKSPLRETIKTSNDDVLLREEKRRCIGTSAMAAFADGSVILPAPRHLYPPDEESIHSNIEVQVMEWNKESVELLASNQHQRCHRLLQRAISATSESREAEFSAPNVRLELRGATFNNLACLYKQTGHIRNALGALESALAIEEMLRVQSPSTLLNFCSVLLMAGKRQEAFIPASRALSILEQEVLQSIAAEEASAEAGDASASLEFDSSIPSLPPPTLPDTGVRHLYVLALHTMAMVKAAQGDDVSVVRAQTDLIDAHAVAMQMLGPNHPTTSHIYRSLLNEQVRSSRNRTFTNAARLSRLPDVTKAHKAL